MQICLLVQNGSFRQWHARLLDKVARCPSVSVRLIALPSTQTGWRPSRAAALNGLLLLERTLSRERVWLVDDASLDAVPHVQSNDVSNVDADLIVDLCALPFDFATGSRRLVPTFDGFGGELALWNALLCGRAPVLALADPSASIHTTLALPALETPHRLMDSSEAVLTHLVSAIVRSISTLSSGRSLPAFATVPAPATPVTPIDDIGLTELDTNAVSVLARRVQQKAAERRDELLKQAPAWQVAYRATANRTFAGEDLPYTFFKLLPDDGQRYFADPFVIQHDGWHHVFVEELPYASGRGVISHFVIDKDGASSQPRVVLEEPHHLSYPQVFRHGGQFWMMPEASSAGRLDLYRAVRFPDRWVHHAQLLDARSARPAGGLYKRKGQLWRPAQDCTGGYGSALTLNRVCALDQEHFSQSLVSTLSFGIQGSGRGPHTQNFEGGIEIIDVFQPRPQAS